MKRLGARPTRLEVLSAHRTDPRGRTSLGRFALVLLLGLLAAGGLMLAMGQGAFAASFSISGALGKLSSDRFRAEGVAQYGSVERSGDRDYPVLAAGFRRAYADNFCQSVRIGGLPGVGPVVFRLAAPDFQAENLLVTAELLNGDIVQRNVQLGRDAGKLDKGPAEAVGRPGTFGLQSDSLEIRGQRQMVRSATAATLRLNQVRIAIGSAERECF